MPYFSDRYLKGVTLIELMLSILLSSLIFGIVITIYLAAQKNFRLQSALSTIQENTMFCRNILFSDLKLTGNIGCPKLTNNFPIINYAPYEITPLNKIHITKNAVTVRHVNVVHANLIQTSEDSRLYLTPEPLFGVGDILLISDCKSAEIFKVKDVSANQYVQIITAAQPFHFQYEKNSEVGRFEENTYFIGDTGRLSEIKTPVLALYKVDINKHKTELVEGVNDLKAQLDAEGMVISFELSSLNLKKRWKGYVSF